MKTSVGVNKMMGVWAKLREFKFHILITILIIVIFIAVVVVLKQFALNPADKLPCTYFESINITDGVRQPNGDIIHKNIVYPKDQYAEVNTVLVDVYDNNTSKGNSEFIKVPSYYRGCLCNRKKCMRICCQPECDRDYENDLEVALSTTFPKLLNNHFTFTNEKPGSSLLPYDEPVNITNDGRLVGENHSYGHTEYCLYYNGTAKKMVEDYEILYIFRDALAEAEEKIDVRLKVMPYLFFISVPFTILTFLVYTLVPELRNLHGKCLLCYLVSLAVFQSLIAWIYVNFKSSVALVPCKLVGYSTYFAIQSTFLWLSVISFDLWWNFRKTSGFMLSEKKRFVFYSIYAWGLSLLMTLFTVMMDYIPGVSDMYKPKMALPQKMCYISPGYEKRLVYIYLPQFILCSVNVLFFLLTALKIRMLQIDLNRVMSHGENSKHQTRLQSEKDNFVLFLRLFIVMGVVWIMESISFLVDSKNVYFFFFDMWNCLQGVLIFAFMVCKRRVFELIKKRFGIVLKKSAATSTATNSSSVYAPNNVAMKEMTSARDKYTEKV